MVGMCFKRVALAAVAEGDFCGDTGREPSEGDQTRVAPVKGVRNGQIPDVV